MTCRSSIIVKSKKFGRNAFLNEPFVRVVEVEIAVFEEIFIRGDTGADHLYKEVGCLGGGIYVWNRECHIVMFKNMLYLIEIAVH